MAPVEYAVWKMDQWMRTVVRGYKGMGRSERRSCAVLLHLHLVQGNCPCGLERCRTRHNLAAQPASGVGVDLFVEQAVIGPVGLCANSVAQGMFYWLLLRPEYRMLVGNVEFKRCVHPRCPNPYREYEAERCPGHGCDSVHDPAETEAIALERLFIQGVYRSVRRWCCGGSHTYRQRHCGGKLVPPFTEVHYQLFHGRDELHDRCPWRHCPNGRPRHPQTPGSTLWVRAELADRAGPSSASPDPADVADPSDPLGTLRLDAIAAGTRQWLDTLDTATASGLRDALAADPTIAPEARDDPLVIANWLFDGRQTVVPAVEMARLRAAIERALRERGLNR
jgi:hypothetical protein